MSHYEFALLAFTSFITLINPFGIIPVFVSMTASLEPAMRHKTARKANLVAFITLVAFAFTGEFLFKFFGISVNSFLMVGGIIFFMLGMDMLQARLGKTRIPKKRVQEYVGDISITPLGIPMITGPGSITNAIVLMQDAKTWDMKGLLIAVIGLVILINMLGLLFASKITHLLGETGNNVMMRLMGLIVMVIAVEFFFSGLKPILQEIFQIGS